MSEGERITPGEAWQKVKSGKAVLVCAYKEHEKFKQVKLKGAVSWSEFLSRLDFLPKNQEIIFYCA